VLRDSLKKKIIKFSDYYKGIFSVEDLYFYSKSVYLIGQYEYNRITQNAALKKMEGLILIIYRKNFQITTSVFFELKNSSDRGVFLS